MHLLRLACLHRITAAELLIRVRAVARHPHFQHYASPFPGDQRLGAAMDWPDVDALLLLDSLAMIDLPSGAEWMPIHSLCGFSFKRDAATRGRAQQGSQCLALP
jgi:hypothetical protein